MASLVTFCNMVLLVAVVQSCDITVDSIINGEAPTELNWPWRTITIDNVDGDDNENCLSDQTVRCKTLQFVLNNTAAASSACLKLVLSKNTFNHVIPYNAPPLSGISIYLVGEGDTSITCEDDKGNATTSWSIQNASFVVFKSLQFSNCSQRLEVANITNVYIEDVKISNFSSSGVRLLNNFNVTLNNFTIVNCTYKTTHDFPENSAVSLVYRDSGRIKSYIQILNSQFHYNSIKVLKIEDASEATIGNSFSGRGGALGIFIIEPIKNAAVDIIIDRCNFTNNTADSLGGAVYLISNGLSSGHNLMLTNTVFNRNYAGIDGGAFVQASTKTGNFSIDTIFTPSHYYLANCNFTQNSADFGGAVGSITALNKKRTTDTVSISSCIFDGNFANTIGAAVMFSSLTVPHLPEQDFPIEVSNCTFKFNTSPAGILGITFKDLEFNGANDFFHNTGPAIMAADSTIAVHGRLNFSHNTFNGVIRVQDFVQFQLYKGSHMNFHSNNGLFAAGISVFIQEYPRVFSQLVHNPWCFLLYEDVEMPPSEWTDVNITFDNNTASFAPNMYISNFDLCSWQNTNDTRVHFSVEEVLRWPVFNYRNVTTNIDRNITSMIEYPESNRKGISTGAQNITGMKSYSARPGQVLTLDLVPRDDFGNPTAFVFGFTYLTGGESVPAGRVAIADLSDSQDEAVILRPNIEEYIPGRRELVLAYELALDNNNSLKSFVVAVYPGVRLEVAQIGITYINITVEECLPGQILRKANRDSTGLTCECDFKRTSGLILSCEEGQIIILKDGLFAFNRRNDIFSTLNILPCPPTYCQCRKESVNSTLCTAVYNHSNEEQQCHPDREGILCGRCRHAHQGVGVLTMLCQNCDNYNVIFPVMLVLFDVALVFLILSSATPFPPSLKGILFYVQAMSYATTSFPLSTWRGSRLMLYFSSTLSLYFPWDFCVYEGMTAMASHLFGYIPFIVALTIIIIILKYKPHGYTSPKGKEFQRIYQKFRSKCAHGIWTLVLLMFMRVVYNAWLIIQCVNVSDKGYNWYVDGNVKCYNDYQHILLFLFGLTVLLFMSGLMIFIGLLTLDALDVITDKHSSFKHLCESASYGYKEQYKWWPFIDIASRYLLVFYWIAFPIYSTLQIFIFLTLFLVHMYAQPYKKPWHNWLQSCILAYIIIFLLLRSTNFIIRSLIPNAYTGIMFPSENTSAYNDRRSSNPLPPSDALTYFFLPLLYLPLAIGLVIMTPMLFNFGKRVILWLYNLRRCRRCFQKSKASYDSYNESHEKSASIRVYRHHGSGVVVTRQDGRTIRVPTTYAEC